jgi:hypothetical protein
MMETDGAGKNFSGAVELHRYAQVSLLRMAIDGFIPLLSSPFVVWLVLSPKAWPGFSVGLFFCLWVGLQPDIVRLKPNLLGSELT